MIKVIKLIMISFTYGVLVFSNIINFIHENYKSMLATSIWPIFSAMATVWVGKKVYDGFERWRVQKSESDASIKAEYILFTALKLIDYLNEKSIDRMFPLKERIQKRTIGEKCDNDFYIDKNDKIWYGSYIKKLMRDFNNSLHMVKVFINYDQQRIIEILEDLRNILKIVKSDQENYIMQSDIPVEYKKANHKKVHDTKELFEKLEKYESELIKLLSPTIKHSIKKIKE